MFSWAAKDGNSSSSSRGCLYGGRDTASTPPHPPVQDIEDTDAMVVHDTTTIPLPPRQLPTQKYLLMVRNKKAMLYTISSFTIENNAAIRIQSIVRQYLSRHVVLRRINHIYITLLNRCALTIQKLVRTVYRKKRSREHHHYETRRRVHAILIQSIVRGWLAREHFRAILLQHVRSTTTYIDSYTYIHTYIHTFGLMTDVIFFVFCNLFNATSGHGPCCAPNCSVWSESLS